MADLERIRQVKALIDDMGLNLAGAEVALKLMNHIEELKNEVARLNEEVNRLRPMQRLEGGQTLSNTPGGSNPSQNQA